MSDQNISESLSSQSSGKQILTSGVVHTFGRENLEIAFLDLKVLFEFKEAEKQDMKVTPIDGKKLRIELSNFDNPIGSGLIRPIEIGVTNGRKIYLAFTMTIP